MGRLGSDRSPGSRQQHGSLLPNASEAGRVVSRDLRWMMGKVF